MCVGPEVALALGATGLGNYMQAKENNSSLKNQYAAKHAVMLQGIQQQEQHQAEANNVLNPTVAGFSAPNQQADLGSLIASRSATINDNSQIPQTGNVTDAVSNAPQVVQNSLADRIGKAVAFNKQQGDALGKLGATGDQMLNNSLSINNAQNKIGTIDNFARADKGVNAAQQEEAYNNARKSPSWIWSGLSDLGTVMGLDAATGGAGMTGAQNGFASAQGAVNGSQAATGAPWIASGDYYRAGV